MAEVVVERLLRRADFLAAAKGRRSAMPTLVLQSRETGCDTARIGFTVSRKVGKATERNRVRRRLREAVRAAAPRHVRPGRDYVVIGRRAALTSSYQQIVADLESAFDRIHRQKRQRERNFE